MIAAEMRTMRKEMEQEFTAKLSKVYDEVRTERNRIAQPRFCEKLALFTGSFVCVTRSRFDNKYYCVAVEREHTSILRL